MVKAYVVATEQKERRSAAVISVLFDRALGLFVLLLIGFVLLLEGGHVAHLSVNASEFPYIPQWIVIFILLLMFSVDLYQNWWEAKVRGRARAPVELHRRKK